jgi:hypothetical protein
MSNYNIGDLVWIPDGTVTYRNQNFIGVPISGPQCGLVLKIKTADRSLSLKVGNDYHTVRAERVRKIESEEAAYG